MPQPCAEVCNQKREFYNSETKSAFSRDLTQIGWPTKSVHVASIESSTRPALLREWVSQLQSSVKCLSAL